MRPRWGLGCTPHGSPGCRPSLATPRPLDPRGPSPPLAPHAHYPGMPAHPAGFPLHALPPPIMPPVHRIKADPRLSRDLGGAKGKAIDAISLIFPMP